MSDENNLSQRKNLDNKTLTLVTTALVAASNLVPNDVLKKACAASSPCITIAGGWVFLMVKNAVYLWIEQKRAKNAYNIIITDLRKKLELCKNVKERSKISKELEKYERDLNDLRINNIKAFV